MIKKISWEFEVEIEQCNAEDEDRRYRANCLSMTGCSVHASTEAKALERIKEAIGVWFHFADRWMDDEFKVEDYL